MRNSLGDKARLQHIYDAILMLPRPPLKFPEQCLTKM